MSRIKRILVPTDFSAASEIAFNYAVDLAAREGATIHVLHVIGDLALTAAYADALAIELAGLRENLMADAQKRLDEAAAKASANVNITTQVLVGQAALLIADTAANRGVDLVVMGTHGRGGFAHLMLGSVAERVVRTAPCPVLTVRNTSRTVDIIAAETVSRRQAAGRA
jgi:nucleotide-binding universal stress UspA family protein